MSADLRVPWLDGRELTKAYGGVLALRDANIQFRSGELRGLIGANGAGKSTLVKILTGITAPTSGAVLIDGMPLRLGSPHDSLAAGIVAVPQELTVAPTMTVAENVVLGRYPRRGGFLRPREMRARTADVLESLSLPIRPDDVVGELPMVYQRLVMVARAFARSARLMIFDEPTATISPREVEYLLDAIRNLARRDISILYVSHRLDEVDEICTAVTVVRDGQIVAELAGEQVTRERLVEHLVGPHATAITAASREPTPRADGAPALELRDVSGPALHGVSFRVDPGEIVGLAGMAGSGAREAVLAACGALPFSRGAVSICGQRVRPGSVPRAVRAGAGFLPGDRSLAAFSSHSIAFNVSLPTVGRHALAGFVQRRVERSAVSALLDRVALRRDGRDAISDLSGGNQQKAIVARWLAAQPALLLLDDPTAGVDIATRPEIHAQIRAMADSGAGVLFLSSDIDELVELSDRVVVLSRGSVVSELTGSDVTPSRILDAMSQREALAAGRT
ncbi:MAG: sugar ABC transporter ATP-binding protein [Actinomycetota bacterium]|nr:sugar ABC transporter ATP-binding protein [Actinomycetota bacterium]